MLCAFYADRQHAKHEIGHGKKILILLIKIKRHAKALFTMS